MSHGIDTTAGQSSFVSAREDAWHQLGVVLPESFTAEEAMLHGHLGGWNVRKVPLAAMLGTRPVAMPGRYATVRDNPIIPGQVDILGDVGEVYQPIQNEEHAAFLNHLVDESGSHFETAGALDGGKRVFITMKLPGHINIGGVDPVENYLAAINSHDGGSSFVVMVTPIRVVCRNTMNLAFRNHSAMFKIRHSKLASAQMAAEARRALDLSFDYLEGFQEQADQLVNTSLTQSRFEEIIHAAFGAPEGAAQPTITRTDNKLESMAQLFADASTQDVIRDTAWAGLNAMTEWFDHFRPTRGEERDIARAQGSLLDPAFKNQALQLMLAEVR